MYRKKRYSFLSFLSFLFILSLNIYLSYAAANKIVRRKTVLPVFHNTVQASESESDSVSFALPLQICSVTSPFGNREQGNHTGVDFAAETDAPVFASADGSVRLSDWLDGYGYTVILTHPNGYETLYAHCNSLSVSVGEPVKQGQEIAKVGSTGNSSGPHLHFEIIKDGIFQDPALYIALPVS